MDVKTGRILIEEDRVVIDFVDLFPRFDEQPATFRDAYGYQGPFSTGVLWDLKEGIEVDKRITHSEIFPIIVHPKRGGGAGNNNLEITIDLGGDETRQFELRQVIQRKNAGLKEVSGYQIVDKGKTIRGRSPDPLVELTDWIEYLNLADPPSLQSTGETRLENGLKKLVLSNGALLDVEVEKTGEGEYNLKGIRVRGAHRERPRIAILKYTEPSGTSIDYEVYLPPNKSSMMFLRNPDTGKFSTAFVRRDGTFCMNDRRDYIQEFITYRSSANFPMMKIVGGEQYTSEARSVTVRRPVITREGAIKTFEVTAVLGRKDGAGAVSLMSESADEKPHIRFNVSEDESGNLLVEKGEVKPTDEGTTFPFGNDYQIDIVEDAWLDARTNTLKRGKVKIVFFQKELIRQADGSEKRLRPYGWIEFENRNQLVGESAKFKVAKAHYHETIAHKKNKLMPSADNYLIYGAGLMIDSSLYNKDGTFKGEGLFDEGLIRDVVGVEVWNEIFNLLHGTRGRKEDLPALLRVLSLLVYTEYDSQLLSEKTPLMTEEGKYNDAVLAELAHFAQKIRPPPDPKEEDNEILQTEGEEEIEPANEEQGKKGLTEKTTSAVLKPGHRSLSSGSLRKTWTRQVLTRSQPPVRAPLWTGILR